jgi:transcription factor TFIIIB component B''
MEPNRPPQAQSKTPRKRKKDYGQKKSKRAETPEDAENEEIDREEIKVVELCKDLRIGKKFTRHDELRQRLKEKLMKTQLASIDPELVSAVVGAGGGGEGHFEAREEEERPALQSTGPQMKIVGDQIVMDNDTLQLDRHKRAQDAQDAQGPIEEVIEDDFSKIITCGTHMKRERAQLWDAASNEIFWKGLRMFGTDFEMIAKLFPSRTRRQIKLKFNKEERDNPTRIDRILRGIGSSIDLDTYEELSGVKLEDVAAIDAERERIEAEQKAEEDKRIAEHAEAEKKKKEAIAAQRAAQRRILGIDEEEDGDPGEKENQELPPGIGEKSLVSSKNPKKGKKHGASGKQKKNRTAADETVQVLGDA